MSIKTDKLKWWILVTVIIGTFLGRLDQTIVNLALPRIIEDFGISVSAAGWIATAYILANAVLVPVWGKLGDTIGRKKVYIIGFSIFIFGSLLCGLAWNLSSMIVFRVIQAIAGSADYPTAMAIIAVTFREPKERAQALGLWSASFAAAAVFGPLIGGPLIDSFGWRSVFLINLPIGILGLVMALIFVEESKDEKPRKAFDWWGAITLGVALSALVLVLDKGIEWGWTSQNALLCYLTVMAFLVIFYHIEKRHEDPIVDFKFFRNSIFVGTLLNNFIVFMGLMGGIFVIPVFASTYLGYSATESGYLFIPMAFAMVTAAAIGGRFTGKLRPQYVIAISTFIAAVGMYMFISLDPRSSAWGIIIPLTVMAFGIGLAMAQRTNAIAAAVPPEEIGIASSVLALVRNIAGAFGIAIFATILTYSTESHVLSIAQHSTVHTTDPHIYAQAVSLVILKAQMSAYHVVFMTAALLLLVGAVSSLFINIKEERKDVHVIAEG
jgi:DHA2 family multidrug resistance protein